MFISLKNIKFNIEIYGENNKSTIVFLHGFSENLTSFYSLLELQKYYKLVLIDLHGHGLTSDNYKAYNFDLIVDDLNELFKKLNINNYILYGYSMGARISLYYINKYPLQIKKLILESTNVGLKTEIEKTNRKIWDKQVEGYINIGLDKFNEYWTSLDLFKSQKNLPKDIIKKIENRRLTQNKDKLIKVLNGLSIAKQKYSMDKLIKVSKITTLITGELDTKYINIMQEMQKESNCDLIKVKNAGHNIHIERANEIISFILSLNMILNNSKLSNHL